MKLVKKTVKTTKASTSKSTKKSAAKKAVSNVREFIDKSLRIVKLVKENPRRVKSLGWKSFEKIKNNMSVDQFVEAGGRLKDLHWDVRHGYLKLVKGASASSKKAA